MGASWQDICPANICSFSAAVLNPAARSCLIGGSPPVAAAGGALATAGAGAGVPLGRGSKPPAPIILVGC